MPRHHGSSTGIPGLFFSWKQATRSPWDISRSFLIHMLARYRAKGSAATLSGHQRLLFIFVSDAGAAPWMEEDRRPVEAHLASCLHWLRDQARRHGAELSWHYRCLPTDQPAVTIDHAILARDHRPGPHHATWQNQAAAGLVGHSGSLGRLWKDLFGKYLAGDTDCNSVVLFCVRRDAEALAFHFDVDQGSEFERERIILFDKGGAEAKGNLDSIMAHEILRIYGAIDARDCATQGFIEVALKANIREHLAAGDVMDFPTLGDLMGYQVGDLTAYLVGWTNVLPTWLIKQKCILAGT